MRIAISIREDKVSPLLDTAYKLVMLGERSTLINLKRMKGGDLYVGFQYLSKN
jgi:hypothetical protein